MSNGYGCSGGGGGYGAGKGWGMGKGISRGRGRRGGGSRDQGMGRGRGNGPGIGRGARFVPLAGSSPPAQEPHDAAKQSQLLKAKAQDLMAQLSAIAQRIAQIEAAGIDASEPTRRQSGTALVGAESSRKLTAVIDQERCITCGLCVDICPEQAISMNYTVAIDSSKCTGCGSCVSECPNGAISLSETAHRAAS